MNRKNFYSFIWFLIFPLFGLRAEICSNRSIESIQENSMKSVCIRVALKENSINSVKEWFRTLMERREETLESLRNEEVIVESAFLDRQPNGDFLIYYMRAKDIDTAITVFQNSSLAIDDYHKSCWGKYCGESTPLEQLLDLDTIQNQTN